MNLLPLRRRAVMLAVAALTPLAVGLATAPAQAADWRVTGYTGTTAEARWLEVGVLPGVPGNIHVGYLYVFDQVSLDGTALMGAVGFVRDLTCPEGVIPERHGDPAEAGCVSDDRRRITARDVTFTMDNQLTTARLTGSLSVRGNEGDTPVDMVWTGVGDIDHSVEHDRSDDGVRINTFRGDTSVRDAQVTGHMGAMVFKDTAGERSNGELVDFKTVNRFRLR